MRVLGPAINNARIDGSGSVAFDGCVFNAWDAQGTGQYSIVAGGSGSVIVRGNDFQQNSNQVTLGAQLDRAVITSNLFRGTTRLAGVQANSVRFQVGLNAADS